MSEAVNQNQQPSKSSLRNRLKKLYPVLVVLFLVLIGAEQITSGIGSAESDRAMAQTLSTEVTAGFLADHCISLYCKSDNLTHYRYELQAAQRQAGSETEIVQFVYFLADMDRPGNCPKWAIPANLHVTYTTPEGKIIEFTGGASLPEIESCDAKFWWNGQN